MKIWVYYKCLSLRLIAAVAPFKAQHNGLMHLRIIPKGRALHLSTCATLSRLHCIVKGYHSMQRIRRVNRIIRLRTQLEFTAKNKKIWFMELKT